MALPTPWGTRVDGNWMPGAALSFGWVVLFRTICHSGNPTTPFASRLGQPSPNPFSTILVSFYSRESSQYADKGLTTPSEEVEDRLRGCKDFFPFLVLTPCERKDYMLLIQIFPIYTSNGEPQWISCNPDDFQGVLNGTFFLVYLSLY